MTWSYIPNIDCGPYHIISYNIILLLWLLYNGLSLNGSSNVPSRRRPRPIRRTRRWSMPWWSDILGNTRRFKKMWKSYGFPQATFSDTPKHQCCWSSMVKLNSPMISHNIPWYPPWLNHQPTIIFRHRDSTKRRPWTASCARRSVMPYVWSRRTLRWKDVGYEPTGLIDIYVYMCKCVYMIIYIYVYMYICICIHVYVYMYKCIYVYVYKCIYVYMY